MIAIYARQSVDKKDSISIETQVEICKKEFGDDKKYRVYIDKGFSGKDTKRPEFTHMVQDIESGIIRKVIVYKLDRISRSTLDFAKIIDMFEKYQIDFISTLEKFDTSTFIGKAILQIIMIFAELERKTIQQRVTDNYYSRGKKGRILGGPVPFGFTSYSKEIGGKITSLYKEYEPQSKWIWKMYELYSMTDMSLGKVSEYLNDKGVLTARGVKWNSGKISILLKNPVYVKADADIYLYYKNKGAIINNDISEFIGENGCFLYGKRESGERKFTDVTNHNLSIALHKGIVPSDMFLACQYKLDRNKQIKNSGKGKHTWLSGFTKCGYCGYAATVVTAWKGAYKYLMCRGKLGLKVCKGYSDNIKIKDVEKIVEKNIFIKVKELEGTKVRLEGSVDSRINNLKLEIIGIENKIENLVSQIAEANSVVMEYINEKITSLDKEKNNLIEKVKMATVENKVAEPLDNILKRMKDWENLAMEDKKEICNSLIEKILITDEEINIVWKL